MTDKKTSQIFERLAQHKQAEGGFLKGALKTSSEHLNPFYGENRKAAGFGRIGGVALGGAMVMDGVFRGKTSNGEDRSVVTRFGEIAIGTAAAGLSALAGKGALAR